MGIMRRPLRQQFPPGSPWNLPGDFGAVVDAISLSLDSLRTFFRGVLTESNASTAVDLLPEWFAEMGLVYDNTQPLASNQKRAKQAWTATGGQDKDYLQAQIQIAFPDISIGEVTVERIFMCGVAMVGLTMVTDYPSWLTSPPTDGSTPCFYYLVTGEVETVRNLQELKNILDRIMPLHMEPVFVVTVRQTTDTGMCGLAITGLAEVGKEIGE